MSQSLIKHPNGSVYYVDQSQIVTRDGLVDNINKAEELLAVARQKLEEFDSINQTLPEPTPEPAPVAEPITDTPLQPVADLPNSNIFIQ